MDRASRNYGVYTGSDLSMQPRGRGRWKLIEAFNAAVRHEMQR